MSDRIAVMNQGRFEQVGTPARALSQPGDALRRKLRRRDQPLAGTGRIGCRRSRRRAPCLGSGRAGAGERCRAGARLRASRGRGAGAGSIRRSPACRIVSKAASRPCCSTAPTSSLLDRHGGLRPARARRAAPGRAARGHRGRRAGPCGLDGGCDEGLCRMNAKPALRLTLFLLLAPAILWLGLPHRAAACGDPDPLLQRARGAAGLCLRLRQYLEFFTEPLYWRTFARTAFMSILVTALTLVLAFPDRALHRPRGAGPR